MNSLHLALAKPSASTSQNGLDFLSSMIKFLYPSVILKLKYHPPKHPFRKKSNALTFHFLLKSWRGCLRE